MADILGKRVIVKVTGRNIHEIQGEFVGKILPVVDWLVGCPVFKDDESGVLLGVGYECDVIKVID